MLLLECATHRLQEYPATPKPSASRRWYVVLGLCLEYQSLTARFHHLAGGAQSCTAHPAPESPARKCVNEHEQHTERPTRSHRKCAGEFVDVYGFCNEE